MAFSQQLPALVNAYMSWMLALGEDGMSGDYTPPFGAVVDGNSHVYEVDLFREYSLFPHAFNTHFSSRITQGCHRAPC
jgi:hypothetical protein